MALFPDLGLFAWVLIAVAAFALMGAATAALRTMPAASFIYRQPKQLAPGKHRQPKRVANWKRRRK